MGQSIVDSRIRRLALNTGQPGRPAMIPLVHGHSRPFTPINEVMDWLRFSLASPVLCGRDARGHRDGNLSD